MPGSLISVFTFVFFSSAIFIFFSGDISTNLFILRGHNIVHMVVILIDFSFSFLQFTHISKKAIQGIHCLSVIRLDLGCQFEARIYKPNSA